MGGSRKRNRRAGDRDQKPSARGRKPTSGGGRATELPVWNEELDKVTWGKLVHVYVQDAENQVRVVKEFCRLGWPECIKNPLPEDTVVDRRQQLRDLRRNLNRTFKGWPLRFRVNTKKDVIYREFL
jgi:hypothetical protein